MLPELQLIALLGTWLLSAAVLTVFWRVTVARNSLNWVDLGWSSALTLLAFGAAAFGDGSLEQRLLVALGPGLWGLRLTTLLATERTFTESREDGRYQALRRHWGEAAPRNIAILFQAEALLATLLAILFWMVAGHEGPITSIQIAAFALYLLAQLGEWTADRQLSAFKRDPSSRGKTCRRGLWRYSRHPNYFFEWLIWCAFALLAVPAQGAAWAALAPLAMLLFLTKVTGIPYSEAQSLRSRGDDYRAYQRSTSPFIPWPPKDA